MKLTKADKKKQKDLMSKMVSPESDYDRSPRLTVSADYLPEIKKWDVGKSYKLELNVKMISKSEGGWNGDQPLEATFKVKDAKNDYEEED